MASLTVTSARGDTWTIAAATGLLVMEAVRKAGSDDLQAQCGGQLPLRDLPRHRPPR